ncbi:DUF3631 domain-containing protein [Arcanobacterium phocae]|uniref:DUF3631 domain-containing protein n=1 Tax=Arcanobacterium phocae TaxID=131112 RepID=UPI001C0EE386|nr:DUF3631 domain-containing protein [Arcanobacterium phocae]
MWTPLIAVADLFGQSWADKARQAAAYIAQRAQETSSDNESDGIKLLEDIRNLTAWKQLEFISSTKLQELLMSMEDSLWREVGLSTRKLATLLKPYGVTPTRSKDGNQRGYKRADLEDVFARYLAPLPAGESSRV